MSKKISYLITDEHVTVNYDGQTHITPRSDGLAIKLIEALRNNEKDKIPGLISAAKRIETFSKGKFTVVDGEIYVNGVVAPVALGRKILKFSNEGLPYEPLVRFAEKLQKNPSFRAVNELFQFLEKNDHPITEEGNFIAYKKVRNDFTDIHSGTFDNSPGAEPTMPRNQVNENPNETCSRGLHVANWDYAHNRFQSSDPATDRMVEVEVDPADVVAVPVDYNQSKMRVCKYVVLGEIDKEHSSDVNIRYTKPAVVESDLHEDEEDDEASCIDCGEDCDPAHDLCDVCYYGEEDKDEYPWKDEVEDDEEDLF